MVLIVENAIQTELITIYEIITATLSVDKG